jgi:hypothetical protein
MQEAYPKISSPEKRPTEKAFLTNINVSPGPKLFDLPPSVLLSTEENLEPPYNLLH